ncbi:MAG: AAA family ATPase [Candidatus Alcyoniella australis]|nr:AAA family ATPase [Candidatus Alcyoniella australis]
MSQRDLEAESIYEYYSPVQQGHEEIIEALRHQLARVSENVLGREEIIEQFTFALLTRNHQLMLGRTGIAKSLLATEIFRIFDPRGVTTFMIKASVEDTKDNYFGPIDIPRYRNTGQKVRRTEKSVLEAHFAFIDEIFDTNEQILRDIMLLLSDGKLLEGSQSYKGRLHTVIAASNYLRMNEVTEAVIDRFFFRANIPHETETLTQYKIDRSYERGQSSGLYPGNLSIEEINYLSSIVKGVSEDVVIELPSDMLYVKNIVIRSFVDTMRKTDPEFYISPRRQAKVIDLLRASALLAGRNVVEEPDLEKMYMGLCTLNSENGETEVFRKTVRNTLQFLSADQTVREQITFLSGVLNGIDEFKRNPRQGVVNLSKFAPPRRRWRHDFLRIVRKPEDQMVFKLETLAQKVNEIKTSTLYVDELKNGCLHELQKLRRIDS